MLMLSRFRPKTCPGSPISGTEAFLRKTKYEIVTKSHQNLLVELIVFVLCMMPRAVAIGNGPGAVFGRKPTETLRDLRRVVGLWLVPCVMQ